MKKSVGLYLTVLSAIAGVVGIVGYKVNCGTNYFVNLGTSGTVMALSIIAVVLQVVYIAVTGKGYKSWHDLLAVIPPALMIAAVVALVGTRVGKIAAVMTYENNAQNMADLTSCIVGIAGMVVAALVGIVASFFDTVKE